MNEACAMTARERGSVEVQLDRLNGVCDSLEDVAGRVAERYGSAIKPGQCAEPENAKESPRPQMCCLAEHMDGAASRLERVYGRLTEMIDSCDL